MGRPFGYDTPWGYDSVREKNDKKLREEDARYELALKESEKPHWHNSELLKSLDTAMNAIKDRKPFEYDINSDQLYQQYKDRYIAQGKQAAKDVMGQAAAMTGGYGNSYAQTVGQQTYDGYLQALNDKIPDLYKLALDKYNREGDDLKTAYALAKDRYDTAYGEYKDDYNRWNADRAYYSDKYKTEREFIQSEEAKQFEQSKFDEAKRQFNLANGVQKDKDGNEYIPAASKTYSAQEFDSLYDGALSALERYGMDGVYDYLLATAGEGELMDAIYTMMKEQEIIRKYDGCVYPMAPSKGGGGRGW